MCHNRYVYVTFRRTGEVGEAAVGTSPSLGRVKPTDPVGGPASDDAEPAVPPPLPRSVLVAAGAVGAQALVFVGYAVSELGYAAFERSGTAVAVAAFLGAYGIALGFAIAGLLRRRLAARAPLVLGQLLHLGLAWNMRDAPLTYVAIALTAVSFVALAGLFAPATTRMLLAAEDPDHR